MGAKYWVQGHWVACKHEAHKLARKLQTTVAITDGWVPVQTIAHYGEATTGWKAVTA